MLVGYCKKLTPEHNRRLDDHQSVTDRAVPTGPIPQITSYRKFRIYYSQN